MEKALVRYAVDNANAKMLVLLVHPDTREVYAMVRGGSMSIAAVLGAAIMQEKVVKEAYELLKAYELSGGTL